MLIAAVVKPAASSASYSVTAPAPRCRRFMSKIESSSDLVSPAARIALKDEPYSTRRFSSRCHQTRCGISCTSGSAPVAIELRHTGVSDGNVETACPYSPAAISWPSAGAAPRSIAASRTAGDSPSMTIRTSFVSGLFGKAAEPRVPLGHPPAQARRERRQRDGFEIADEGHERDPGEHERGEPDEHPGAPPCAATAQRPGDDLPRPERPGQTTQSPADRLVPVFDQEPEQHADGGRRKRRHEPASAPPGDQPRCEHADRDAEPGA